ncbi:MAG: nucleotidyltransferase domain-containing protein [archaeon]|nr:nucleotidyltransferase domain-containing protein [archaeon]
MTSKLDRLFGSKTRIALLSKFMMDSNKQFYIRELSKELNIPYGMLHREVKNLASLGILAEEKKGKITLVSVNKKLPYFAELRGMMMKTAGLGDLMRGTLSELKGIRYALIYGSFASGEETESSDIDLLIVGNLSEEEVLKAVSQVEKEVRREINYILWSEKEFLKRVKSKHHLLEDVAKKPMIMLVGDEDEFRRAAKK